MIGPIYFGDNLDVLGGFLSGSVDLIYIDPPFNTGKVQERTQLRTVRSENGDRLGFQDYRYQSFVLGEKRLANQFDDYLAFLEAYRVLASHGSFYFHIDYREVHYWIFRWQRHNGGCLSRVGRRFIIVDNNPQALEVMARRLMVLLGFNRSVLIQVLCSSAFNR